MSTLATSDSGASASYPSLKPGSFIHFTNSDMVFGGSVLRPVMVEALVLTMPMPV